MGARLTTRVLRCTKCWSQQRVPVAYHEDGSVHIYPNCGFCGVTEWIALVEPKLDELPEDLQPTPSCGHTPVEHELIRRNIHAIRAFVNGELSPSELTPEQRRIMDRYLRRDEDSPERQPWWNTF